MGTDLYAFIDYDEWHVDHHGRPYLGCWTVAQIHLLGRPYSLFELMASIRRGSIELDLEIARRVDPGGMARWDQDHPDPFPLLEPKGLPERLGWGEVKFRLQRMGIVSPGDDLYGKPMKSSQIGTIYSWPPDGKDDYYRFSWLSAKELRQVADRFRVIPKQIYAERPPGGWGTDPDTGMEDRTAPGRYLYDVGEPTLDGAVAMMDSLNAGREDATRFVFWFEH